MPQTIVAMVSSNLARAGHPSRVSINLKSPEGVASGLRLDSVIMTDNLVTVLESEIDSVVGRLPDMVGVDTALRRTLGLS